jgi:hypothetical protein
MKQTKHLVLHATHCQQVALSRMKKHLLVTVVQIEHLVRH